MKIAFLLDTFPSLTETFIARDIEALRRHGLEIEVFALYSTNSETTQLLTPPKSAALLTRGALEKIISPGVRAGYFKAFGAAWWQQLQARGATTEINHIHAGWASHPAYIAWGAAEKANLSWSFSGHARDIFVMGGDLQSKLAAARFAAVCTKAAARHLENIAPEHKRKILYAPHGIEAQRIEFGSWNALAVPQILSVGRLVEKKGFGVLLDACAILQARGFAFTARVIGGGPLYDALIRRRDRLNLQNVVQFSGTMPQSEVLTAMRAASCLAVPAITAHDGDRDGLPNVILEAAACGLPLVATRAGAIEEFVDETTGTFCAPGRAEDLAAALASIFSERERTEKRRHVARQRVEQQFDLMTNAARLAQALQKASADN